MRHSLTAIFLLSGLLFLGGCGQTGPLYLPNEKPEEAPEEEPEPRQSRAGGTTGHAQDSSQPPAPD
jgi:predicted small lipoprotein YifL